MPEPLKVRNRARLREKDAERLAQELEAMLGVAPWPPGTHLDKAESQLGEVLVSKGRVLAFFLPAEQGGKVAPTVRLLLECKPTLSYVTVDMGAVKFVNNGADIMGPGIVEADPALVEGGVCWVRDERNKRPLAIGQALVTGAAMPKQPGKKVRNLQRVGDELWEWEA
ncbi:MAG TPA: PUA domain-containing protein [Candidatus Thermoplasmatota archaeon]|nr:PUA domain-containing protein [Candidatus Thermoplasmatota archaeon]